MMALAAASAARTRAVPAKSCDGGATAFPVTIAVTVAFAASTVVFRSPAGCCVDASAFCPLDSASPLNVQPWPIEAPPPLSTGTSHSVCLSFAGRLLRCLLSHASASHHLLLCSCLTCSSLIPPLSSCQLVVTSHHFTLPPPLNASSPHDWLCRHTNAPYSMTITMCHNAKHIDQHSRSRSTVDATGRHHWASIHHVSPRLRPWS